MFRHIRLFRYGFKKFSTFQPPGRNGERQPYGDLINEIKLMTKNLGEEIECVKRNIKEEIDNMERNLREENKSIGEDLKKEIEQSLRNYLKNEIKNLKIS
ncbi:hypothetical protein RclHR1_01680022 [Rhizophagus clarus]|uniref:Uncharacterized protein n=1 Tax=Rhizophagus clarus TaxID=94130 RepID=A0A2Z6QZ19_9GLOM|nr:hypothetical protein RclHR1_01680022 [Rhizophagus clarus]GES83771.1 hypothetical protein RCL_jg9556.t1 [Rhizophagus clarus]